MQPAPPPLLPHLEVVKVAGAPRACPPTLMANPPLLHTWLLLGTSTYQVRHILLRSSSRGDLHGKVGKEMEAGEKVVLLPGSCPPQPQQVEAGRSEWATPVGRSAFLESLLTANGYFLSLRSSQRPIPTVQRRSDMRCVTSKPLVSTFSLTDGKNVFTERKKKNPPHWK